MRVKSLLHHTMERLLREKTAWTNYNQKRSTRHIAPGTTLSSNRLCLNNYNVSLDYSLHLTAFSVPKLYVEHKYVIIALSF